MHILSFTYLVYLCSRVNDFQVPGARSLSIKDLLSVRLSLFLSFVFALAPVRFRCRSRFCFPFPFPFSLPFHVSFSFRFWFMFPFFVLPDVCLSQLTKQLIEGQKTTAARVEQDLKALMANADEDVVLRWGWG